MKIRSTEIHPDDGSNYYYEITGIPSESITIKYIEKVSEGTRIDELDFPIGEESLEVLKEAISIMTRTIKEEDDEA